MWLPKTAMARRLAAATATWALAVSVGVTAPTASASIRPTCAWQPQRLADGHGRSKIMM